MANENEKVLKARFKQKHDIEANWIKAGNAETPFVPLAGEIIIYDDRYFDADGVEHIVADSVRSKVGNGVNNVNELPFTDSSINTRVDRIFGVTGTVQEAVRYDESKLTWSDYIDVCEYYYAPFAIQMIFNESDFTVNNPIHIKFIAGSCYTHGYIYKSLDGQIYIGDQEFNTGTALKMCKIDSRIYIVMYPPDDYYYTFGACASVPFDINYNNFEESTTQTIPEKTLYMDKEIEIYDTVKEAKYAETAGTASTAIKASQDSNGYSFITYYAKHPSSNPLSISGDNLQVKYTKGNGSGEIYSVDLSKATAITTAASNVKELIGYEVADPSSIITFDASALNYEKSYSYCSYTSDRFCLYLSKSDIEAKKDEPIYIRVTAEYQTKDYTIIYSPDNAEAEGRGPYITAYSSEDIPYTDWYENDNYIWLEFTTSEHMVYATARCNIPFEVTYYSREYTNTFYAYLQQVSLEKIEKFTPAACAKGILAEDGKTRLDIASIKQYIDEAV